MARRHRIRKKSRALTVSDAKPLGRTRSRTGVMHRGGFLLPLRSARAIPNSMPFCHSLPYRLLNQDRHAPPHAASPVGRLAIGRDERLVDGRRGLPSRRRVFAGRADPGYVNLGLTAEHATVDEKPSDSEVLKRTSSAQRKLLSNKDRSPERSLSISRNELDRNARCLPNSATFRHFEPAPLLNQAASRIVVYQGHRRRIAGTLAR